MKTEKLVLTPQKASFLVAVLAGGRAGRAGRAGRRAHGHQVIAAMQHEVSCTNFAL